MVTRILALSTFLLMLVSCQTKDSIEAKFLASCRDKIFQTYPRLKSQDDISLVSGPMRTTKLSAIFSLPSDSSECTANLKGGELTVSAPKSQDMSTAVVQSDTSKQPESAPAVASRPEDAPPNYNVIEEKLSGTFLIKRVVIITPPEPTQSGIAALLKDLMPSGVTGTVFAYRKAEDVEEGAWIALIQRPFKGDEAKVSFR